VIADTITSDDALVDYMADRLVELGDSVPEEIEGFKLDTAKNPFTDKRFWDFKNYPEDMWVKPGANAANRAGFAKWGAYVNSMGRLWYNRPLFLAMSADLAESTNIAGFMEGYGDVPGWGRYNRNTNQDGALLPQEITEFTNSGVSAGIASVNFSQTPYEDFNGFYAAHSTYGSFSYLKYGLMRLFSQLAQDSQIRVGKVLWVAGHSGPETAEDSRTHFGIFSPGVTQLFPDGNIINLYPWEYNEVPVLLGAAFATDVPIIALHLTRPPIAIPDREALGIASHFEAAKGAYLLRDYKPGQPRGGTIAVQGTMSTANVVSILPKLDEEGLNVKLVAAVSQDLFRMQPKEYRDSIISPADQVDMTYITNGSRRTMHDWIANRIADEYAMSADFDNRWRTGGSPAEVYEEAHLSPKFLLEGIRRFVAERDQRLSRIDAALAGARR
jgi:transketolase